MHYQVMINGASRSFPGDHRLLAEATTDGDVVILLGARAGRLLPSLARRDERRAILVELGTECLGVHTGEQRGTEGSNVIGFARFRLGDAEPSELVELVVQPNTAPAALAGARALFEGAGLHTAVCRDSPGRILDRLLRPFFNATLQRLDEGLASADDMDLTLKLGLGYPEGTIVLLERTGLAPHAEISQALFDALGDPGFVPARRAQVAKARAHR
jgi:3-hydroxybutyryl-CoA dehydrogenase